MKLTITHVWEVEVPDDVDPETVDTRSAMSVLCRDGNLLAERFDPDEEDVQVAHDRGRAPLLMRARADFARWCGKRVSVRTVWGGNGDGAGDFVGYVDLLAPAAVTVGGAGPDCHWSAGDKTLETMYLIHEVPVGLAAMNAPPDVTATHVDGPTYHADGRVEYPEWWQ